LLPSAKPELLFDPFVSKFPPEEKPDKLLVDIKLLETAGFGTDPGNIHSEDANV
jgi:hypothetical protein